MIKINQIIKVFLCLALLSALLVLPACGGGGSNGSNLNPEAGSDFVAKIITPLEPDVSIHPGDYVYFTCLHLVQTDVTYKWDFGDGTTSEDKDPGKVTFMEEGDFTVTLTVSRGGIVKTDTREVNVAP
jgi:hypothetical protein